MKRMGLSLFFLFLLFCFSNASDASVSLQQQIDGTNSGGVLQVKEGVYEEAVIISKPITIEGTSGTTIRYCGEKPVVSIEGQHVKLKNITIEQCGASNDTTAVYMRGEEHALEEVTVQTKGFGVKLDGVSKTNLYHVRISGSEKGNGIDLWESNGNHIENADIKHARDGIYLENSHHNRLLSNEIRQSRYGIHLMFSDGTELLRNKSYDNITGAMIMGTKETTVRDNQFIYNQENVNAQGLLLYDAISTNVIGNTISHNRVGIYVEKAPENVIAKNEVSNNFIGIQFKEANRNTVEQNTFIGNVYEAQAVKSAGNTIERNYWDNSLKLDTAGRGVSSLSYKADPFFLTLTNAVPHYQLFFGAPGMIVVEKLLKGTQNAWLEDKLPSMDVTVQQETEAVSPFAAGGISIAMLIGSTMLYIWGRKI
ncbi:MAG: nitrous oxide reductase family maturation protein NosD [Ectobacillus sp.]